MITNKLQAVVATTTLNLATPWCKNVFVLNTPIVLPYWTISWYCLCSSITNSLNGFFCQKSKHCVVLWQGPACGYTVSPSLAVVWSMHQATKIQSVHVSSKGGTVTASSCLICSSVVGQINRWFAMQSRRKPPVCQTIMFAISAAYSKDNRDLISRKRLAGNKHRFSITAASLSKAFYCGVEMKGKKKEKHNLPAQSLRGKWGSDIHTVYILWRSPSAAGLLCVSPCVCVCLCDGLTRIG